MGIKDHLLRLARRVVESVVNEILAEVTKITDLMENVVEGYLKEIVNGAWEGEDADAFVAEVRSIITSQGLPLRDSLRDMTSMIQTADEIIEQADNQVQQIASDLGEKFGQVF